jgi:UDP-N-acetyl-D-mannosaminuronate dehydrogenase
MPLYTVRVLESLMESRKKKLPGATVALLGLSYKRDIPDLRESPALVIQSALVKEGAQVRSFDPYLLSRSSVRSLDEALDGADAIIIATDHTLFRSLTPEDIERHGIRFLVDGRNCLDKDAFVESSVMYRGIGR